MDPYPTYTGAVRSGSTLFGEEALNISAKSLACDFIVICALRVNKCEFSVRGSSNKE